MHQYGARSKRLLTMPRSKRSLSTHQYGALGRGHNGGMARGHNGGMAQWRRARARERLGGGAAPILYNRE